MIKMNNIVLDIVIKTDIVVSMLLCTVVKEM